MGYTDRQCVHGFRGLFKTAASESGKWRSEAVEMQLAHARGGAVEAAYNDAEYLPERRESMQWWSNRLDAMQKDAELPELALEAVADLLG